MFKINIFHPYVILLKRMMKMKKGFKIVCVECNEEMVLDSNYIIEEDNSKLSVSPLGNYPFQSLYFVCTNCGNDLEVNS